MAAPTGCMVWLVDSQSMGAAGALVPPGDMVVPVPSCFELPLAVHSAIHPSPREVCMEGTWPAAGAQGSHSETGLKWMSALVEVPIPTYLPWRYSGWSLHQRKLESHMPVRHEPPESLMGAPVKEP